MTGSASSPGKLYLVPSPLGDTAPIDTIPAQALALLQTIDHLIVESPKQARRILHQIGIRVSTRPIKFSVLDEHTPDSALPPLLGAVLEGNDAAILSDAGCPAIADPGAKLVRLAHAQGIAVMPVAGPSSIALALMGSGMNGQRFAFHGYLPVEARARARALVTLEKDARTHRQTQIFIETPYRNPQMLAAILESCAAETLLCIASELTLPTQFLHTQSVAKWRRSVPDLSRRPTVFLLGEPED